MKKYIYTLLTFLSIFILSACGGSGGGSSASSVISGAENEPSVVLRNAEKILTDINGINFTLPLHFVKNENGNYKIELNNLDLEVEGCTMDTSSLKFNPSTVILDGNALSRKNVAVSGSFASECKDAGSKKYSVSSNMKISINGKVELSKLILSSEDASGGDDVDIPAVGYAFINASTPLTISQANAPYEVKVQLIKDGFIAPSKDVRLAPFDAKFGDVSNYSTTTGSDGYAIFDYTSPAVLPANGSSTSIEVSFMDESNATIKQNIVLNFNTSGGGGVNPFNLVNPSTPIGVTAGNQVHNITANVVDASTNVGVSGKDVTITTIANGYGSVDTATATTDAAGQVTFVYTSPNDIVPIDGNNTTVYLRFNENGITSEQAVVINFTASGGGGNQFSLINANDISIKYASESKEIAVQLIKGGVPQSGEIVVAKSIPLAFGRIQNASVSTGTDGYARFTYIASDPLTDGTQALELIYTDANGVIVSQTVNIVVTAASLQLDYNLTNVTTPVIVNYDDELKTISVDVVNQSGVGIKDIDVNITVVPGVQFGSIISASSAKSDSSGRAVFTYKAPSDVAAVDSTSTMVTLSMETNGVILTRDVSLEFNKIDLNVSVPVVVISNNFKEMNLTQNSQNVQMEIQVFEKGSNTPFTSGNVKVSLPNEVLTGTDVGSFSEYTVAVGTNGKAVFNYTGPQDLQSLFNNGDLNATFKFFHEDNPTQQETITVIYDLQAGYIPANYVLTTSSSDGNQTMGLQLLKSFTLYLKDDQGTLVDDAAIDTISITSQNTLIGQLVDPTNGNNVATLAFNAADATNSKSFSIQTYTLSGLLPVEITVDFNDANGDPQTLTTTMNIVVLSGPPTALSISYAGVEQNSSTAKYIEKFAVTVTDAYSNPVNTQPYIAVGAIVEYAVDGSSGTGIRTTTSPRLWHGLNDARGEVEALGATAQLTTTVDAFNHVDIGNDRLVVFGEGFVFEALGKWDIDNIANRVLGLKDSYFGTTRPNVLFAVGHNNRQDLCAPDARQYVGNMKATNYQLDVNGHAFVEFEYDYHLTGKDIMVWVNLTGFQADNGNTGRIGEAKKHTLRGAGFVSHELYTLKSGSTGVFPFRVEHENAPEVYRNGHFAASTSGACTVTGIVNWSNHHDARDCQNLQGYIVLDVINNTLDDCTIQLENRSIVVTPEFNGVSTF